MGQCCSYPFWDRWAEYSDVTTDNNNDRSWCIVDQKQNIWGNCGKKKNSNSESGINVQFYTNIY